MTAPTSMSSGRASPDDTEPSMKEIVFAAKEPSQTPSRALRPSTMTAARAKPAAGKTGEMLPGGIVNEKLALATAAYTNPTATTGAADDMKRFL